MTWATIALRLGLSLYALNLALGVSVQLGVVSTRRVRWVHHVLYGLVFAGAGLAALTGLVARARVWPLALTLIALAAMPRLRGGTRWHRLAAVLGGAGYVLAALTY